MEEIDIISDEELLVSLRMDYLQALEAEDYLRIYHDIAPRFWKRFKKYYEDYAKSWKDPSLIRLPVRLVMDPSHQDEIELHWMDQVLKGEIHLITW